MGMTETLFDRLQSLESTISLTLNYRMNKTITDLANSLTYNGELLVANESVGTSTLNIPKEKALFESCKNQQWIVKALDTKLKSAVKIIDTGAVWNRNDEVEWSVNNKSEINKNSVHNIHEAAIIANLANALMEGGVLPQNMGVIATFNNQVKQLSSLLNPNIDVSTVDQFQGRDKNIIFYSCTKSVHRSEESGDRKFDIMEDHRRLNVAITRAKNKLILVGDLKTVQMYKPFSKLLKCVENSQIMKLQDDIDGFSWSFVLNNVRK
ncbi:hypothetical protein HHI36_018239 [Cryptolaemus montrouzieri]|uniref:DNA2/NAM7 helicase-like C-terminal domain-containing protein n=1 Tax=Cryptolaemus montrouzieri TaxID=559131 RepID=A0ABD2NZD4_9CUCU